MIESLPTTAHPPTSVTGLSTYRLGDIFWGNLGWSERAWLTRDQPDSIGAAFAKASLARSQSKDAIAAAIAHLLSISRRKCVSCPRFDAEVVAVHLRLGDVVCGLAWHERGKRPFPISSLQALARTWPPSVPRLVFAAEHVGFTGDVAGGKVTRDGSFCHDQSERYKQAAVRAVNGTLAHTASADCDLCAMLHAQNFVEGQGCFSAMVAALRLSLGRVVSRTRDAKGNTNCNVQRLIIDRGLALCNYTQQA